MDKDRIDKSLLAELPEGYRTGTARGDGLYADFHEDGGLAHLGRYRQGRLVGPALYMDRQGARVETLTVERYDDEEPLLDWARAAIARVAGQAEGPRMACSFCGKTNQEVRKLIAGPTVYICDECVNLCVEILQS